MRAVPDAGAARLGAGAAQPGPAGSRPDVDSESMEDLLEWELQVAEGVRAVPPHPLLLAGCALRSPAPVALAA